MTVVNVPAQTRQNDLAALCIRDFATGYLGTLVVNFIRPGLISIAPLHVGIGIEGSRCIISTIKKVMKACLPHFQERDLCANGIGIYATCKAMQSMGWIVSFPILISWAALFALVVTIDALVARVLSQDTDQLELELQNHLQSGVFAKRTFSFAHEGQEIPVTIICNPKGQTMNYEVSNKVLKKSSLPYALFSEKPLPSSLEKAIKAKLGGGDAAVFSLPKDSSTRNVQLFSDDVRSFCYV